MECTVTSTSSRAPKPEAVTVTSCPGTSRGSLASGEPAESTASRVSPWGVGLVVADAPTLGKAVGLLLGLLLGLRVGLAPTEALGVADALALGVEVGLVLVFGDGEADPLGEADTLGEADALGEALADVEALGEGDALDEADGLADGDADGPLEGLTDAEGEVAEPVV